MWWVTLKSTSGLFSFSGLKWCVLFSHVFQSDTKVKMESYLKITVCLLLIVHSFHLASLRHTTDSPGVTIDKGWLRKILNLGMKQAPVTNEQPGFESEPYADAEDPNNEDPGIPSGSMTLSGDANMSSREMSENRTSGNGPLPHKSSNHKAKKPKTPNTPVAPTTTTTIPTNSSQRNMTEAEEESHNSTTTNQTSTHHSTNQSNLLHPSFH